MENTKTSTAQTTDFMTSSVSRYEGLVDIPLSDRIIDALTQIFDYFDIHAPKMGAIYTIVTYIRFFQLIGPAFFASNEIGFEPGTLTYKTMSIISVFFHAIPLEYRIGHASIILYVINSFLSFFAIYLVAVAFSFKKTTRVSTFNCYVLSMYLAICPFLMLPLVIQYSGQIISAYLVRAIPVTVMNVSSIIYTVVVVFCYMFIMLKAYSSSLVFRAISFQTIEHKPQNRLLITTMGVTLISSFTTYVPKWPTLACIILSIFFYINCCTTIFNCGTFIKHNNRLLVLGGSIYGILLCLANIYPIFDKPWKPIFFAAAFVIGVITFLFTNWFILRFERNQLVILDEIEESNSIMMLKSKNKLKQLLAAGYENSHICCTDFIIFKLGVEEWKDAVDLWGIYGKFVAIYPEKSSQLQFIANNVAQLKIKNNSVDIILSGAAMILKTRESKFTPELKRKISKLSKLFNKTKNRLRNIWDLVLQGNINELNNSIGRTHSIVNQAKYETNYLVSQYPNNKYVARQYFMFTQEILADPILAHAASDNLQKIQRGLRVSIDSVHELGMIAFPNIPDIASELDTSTKGLSTTEETPFDDLLVSQDDVNIDAVENIHRSLENHKIPGIQFVYKSTIFAFICLTMLPLIGLTGFFYWWADEISKPLNYMQGIALSRNEVALLSAFSGRFLFQELDDPQNPGTKLMPKLHLLDGFTMHAFGDHRSTRDIIQYIAMSVGESAALMSPIRSYKDGNVYMEEVRKLIFGKNLNFSFYINNTYAYQSITAGNQFAFMIATHVGKLLEHKVITPEIANGADSITARNNNNIVTPAMTEALNVMLSYLVSLNDMYQKIFLAIMIALIALNVIIYPIIYFVGVKKLNSNNFVLLHTMTTLPKTVISGISASLSKIKDGNASSMSTEDELNRQEESIMKLFSSISDGSGSTSIQITNAIIYFIIVGLAAACYYLTISTFMKSSTLLVYNSHHINYLFGCVVYLYSVMSRIFKVALATCDPVFRPSIINLQYEISETKRITPYLVSYFQLLRLGGELEEEMPFPNMEEAVTEASVLLYCTNYSTPPTNLMESVHCFSAPQQYFLSVSIIERVVGFMSQESPIYPDPRATQIQHLWQVGPIELYEAFFYKTGNEIVPLIKQNLFDNQQKMMIYAAIFASIIFILSLIIVFMAKRTDTVMKYALSLYLRCPPNALMNNQRIMDLLSGIYENEHEDTAMKHTSFYNDVVNKLDDVVIVCQDETSTIISVNTAFETAFGIKQEDIEKKPFKEFFTTERFQSEEKLEKIFSKTLNVIFRNENGDKVYMEFSTSTVSGRRIFMGRNKTQNVIHEKLIADEKKKSDSMLASILPPMLVPRVQAGEKNISFAVQSATVLFLDVVSFTPWCGSHDAQYVMRILNIMFKEFDAITNDHKTMTKIKCIGDCYMAAGGIFDEVNQPAVHAKEVVDFGCLVIKKLQEIDENENESLRIRVGINTGGPIVAGVIGTEKPTFEILGPAINIAHEMESHGVPMKVHISRPVYELIYGQSFDIKERGEIDVKGGKMFTYIVEP